MAIIAGGKRALSERTGRLSDIARHMAIAIHTSILFHLAITHKFRHSENLASREEFKVILAAIFLASLDELNFLIRIFRTDGDTGKLKIAPIPNGAFVCHASPYRPEKMGRTGPKVCRPPGVIPQPINKSCPTG